MIGQSLKSLVLCKTLQLIFTLYTFFLCKSFPNTGCFILICHFRITYISITVGDMKTKLFLLKTDVFKFLQQKFECRNQRNKHFIKLFTNVQYVSPWLHGTH